ncbi:hypothetical protein EAE91_06725 [Photorhabdus noenieputensis]|nr:hypothetical protein [Photorhabdus noenieputensis]
MKFYLKLGVACFDMATKPHTRLQVTLSLFRYNKSPESEYAKQKKIVTDTDHNQSVFIMIGEDAYLASICDLF